MKRSRPVYFLMFLLVVFASRPQQCWSQFPPQPSGKYSIGHHRFEWTDTSRMEVLAADNTSRRIVADVWYPAEKTSRTTVPYLDTFAIKRAFGDEGLQSFLGSEGTSVVRSGRVQTHAYENAAFD